MISFDLLITHDRWQDLPDLESTLERAFQAIFGLVERSGEIALQLTGDTEMQRLNAQFRGKDRPTDVLSFPADERDAPFLGDLAVGYEISAADAESAGKTLPDHLSHLVIHGYLHLLGYNHEEDADAEEMEALERRALASLGIADPYSQA